MYPSGTEPGSSGSPILEEVEGDLVIAALHRGGKETAQGHLGYNFGSQFAEILKSLRNEPHLSSTY